MCIRDRIIHIDDRLAADADILADLDKAHDQCKYGNDDLEDLISAGRNAPRSYFVTHRLTPVSYTHLGCRKPYKNVRFGAGNVSHIDGKAGPAPVTIAAVRPGPIHRWDRAPMQGGCLVYEYLGSKGSAQGLHHPLWREPGGGAAQCQF